jgi:hypothetical protein
MVQYKSKLKAKVKYNGFAENALKKMNMAKSVSENFQFFNWLSRDNTVI